MSAASARPTTGAARLTRRRSRKGFSWGNGSATVAAGISTTAFVGPAQQTDTAFNESVTAPLPVTGFRLTYKITRKWGVLASTDWFLLNYNDEYKGILSDTQIYAAHRTFKHVGFAGGINFQTFDVEWDDGNLLWQFDARMVGILGAMTFYF